MVSSSRAALGILLAVVLVVAASSVSVTSSAATPTTFTATASNAIAPRRTLLGKGGVPGDGDLAKKGETGEKGEEKGENFDDPPPCTEECKRYEESVKTFCTSRGFNEKKYDWATAGLSVQAHPWLESARFKAFNPCLNEPAPGGFKLCFQVGHLAQCHYTADEEKGIYSFCPFCSIWTAEPEQNPSEIQAHHTYYQQVGRIISLACRGPVEIKVVFEVLSETCEEDHEPNGGDDCSSNNCARLMDSRNEENGNHGTIKRCEVDSPDTCTTCSVCPDSKKKTAASDDTADGGPTECPQEVGKSYSDSLILTLPNECESPDYSGWQDTWMPRMLLGVGTKIKLTAFEINSVVVET